MVVLRGGVVLLNPECPFHLDAFNDRTFTKIAEQAVLAGTLGSFETDTRCVPETRIQDPIAVIRCDRILLPHSPRVW